MNTQEIIQIRKKIILALKEIFDPEIPVNIWDLGIVYGVDVQENLIKKPVLNLKNSETNLELSSKKTKKAIITMTLTSPNCPAIESLPAEIKQKVKEISEINEVTINLVWEPIWNQNLMTEEARLELGML